MTFKSLTLAALLLGSAAHAAGDALVIGNSRYDRLQTLFGAARVVAAAEALRDKGFDVAEARDANSVTMRRAFNAFLRDLKPSETGPVVVILSGAFVHGAGGAYLLPVDRPQDASSGRALLTAFPLDAALAVLAQYPGRAFLVLGESVTDSDDGRFLQPGLGQLDIPQGVTVIRGPGQDVARFAARELATPGRDLINAARAYALDLSGYLPAEHVAIRPGDVRPRTSGATDLGSGSSASVEAADHRAWQTAQNGDSKDSYQAYLNVYPRGLHAAQARQRLAAIEAEPYYAERRAEEALNLTRDQRRQIQQDLNLLGFNTRGIDGIFGAGSRRAIAQWQQSTKRRTSGYLDEEQIVWLDAQATRRARELEEEEKRAAEERERQDRALWQRAMISADEAGLRNYLEVFPEGLFADRARELLKEIEDERERSAQAQDRRAWDLARTEDSIAAYQRYLKDRPGGAFAQEARARILELERASDGVRDIARAKAEEEALNLNPLARRLAETRLIQLGFLKGAPDGRFDKATRTAIRRFQKARGVKVTGYIDQETVVRLLAGGLGRN